MAIFQSEGDVLSVLITEIVVLVNTPEDKTLAKKYSALFL